MVRRKSVKKTVRKTVAKKRPTVKKVVAKVDKVKQEFDEIKEPERVDVLAVTPPQKPTPVSPTEPTLRHAVNPKLVPAPGFEFKEQFATKSQIWSLKAKGYKIAPLNEKSGFSVPKTHRQLFEKDVVKGSLIYMIRVA